MAAHGTVVHLSLICHILMLVALILILYILLIFTIAKVRGKLVFTYHPCHVVLLCIIIYCYVLLYYVLLCTIMFCYVLLCIINSDFDHHGSWISGSMFVKS